jgi:hypothetical protein
MKNLLLTVVICSLATCSVSAQKKPNPPTGWNLISSECGPEFYLPPDFKQEKVQTIDSCGERYRGENTILELSALIYISRESLREPYSGWRDFKYKKTKVDGRRAEIITYYARESPSEGEGLNYVAVLAVPKLWKDRGNLTISAYSRSSEERESAQDISGGAVS